MDTDSALLVQETEEENYNAIAPKDRGKAKNDDEKKDWLAKNELTELSKEGKEAFFRYLRGDKYREDQDICEIDPKAEGMNTRSRRYQFWLQCQQVEFFSKVFEVYVTGEDEKDRFSEVEDCFEESRSSGGEEDFNSFLSQKKKNVKDTEDFVIDLKSKMQTKLNTDFQLFKAAIEKGLKDKS